MTSITVVNNRLENDESKDNISGSFPTDKYRYVFEYSTSNPIGKTARALSYNEEHIQSSTNNNNNNRLKHLCTRLKRRFSISKDYHPHPDNNNNNSNHRAISLRSNHYKAFSSSMDESFTEFEWPDFERIYDTIPHCLAKALPGLDDISLEDEEDEEDEEHVLLDSCNFLIDNTDELAHLFKYCKRGQHFRRNAICRKIDKSQHHGQLDTFIQQLMIEKLMRTWT